MAAKLLIDQIESTGDFTPVIKTHMTKLVIRDSSRKK
jgi:DNA-binding LacI/PurR family transcriptional regulator